MRVHTYLTYEIGTLTINQSLFIYNAGSINDHTTHSIPDLVKLINSSHSSSKIKTVVHKLQKLTKWYLMSLHPLLEVWENGELRHSQKLIWEQMRSKHPSLILRTRFFIATLSSICLGTTYFLVISFVLLFSITARAANREYIIYFVLAVTIINDWI